MTVSLPNIKQAAINEANAAQDRFQDAAEEFYSALVREYQVTAGLSRKEASERSAQLLGWTAANAIRGHLMAI